MATHIAPATAQGSAEETEAASGYSRDNLLRETKPFLHIRPFLLAAFELGKSTSLLKAVAVS